MFILLYYTIIIILYTRDCLVYVCTIVWHIGNNNMAPLLLFTRIGGHCLFNLTHLLYSYYHTTLRVQYNIIIIIILKYISDTTVCYNIMFIVHLLTFVELIFSFQFVYYTTRKVLPVELYIIISSVLLKRIIV